MLSSLTGVGGKIVSGWGLHGFSAFQTGTPLNLSTAVNNTNSFGGGSRPNSTGISARLTGPAQQRLNRWFDTSAFTTPALFAYGNAGRNILYGPGRVNFDFSVFKEFRVQEGFRLQFRTEIFNVFNTTQLDLPNASIGAGTAGTITQIVGTPRQIQFGLKAVF
jgi:hypothetical protein